MKKRLRKVTSVAMFLAFAVLLVTAIDLEFGPHEEHGRPDGPGMAAGPMSDLDGDAPREYRAPQAGGERPAPPLFPKRLHEWAGWTALFLGLCHVLFNGAALLSYVGLRLPSRRREPAPVTVPAS